MISICDRYFLVPGHVTDLSGRAVEGSLNGSLTIPCNAAGSPSRFEWRKNGILLPNSVTSSLRLTRIRYEDIGRYKCTPYNSDGNFNSSTIQLDVRGKCK